MNLMESEKLSRPTILLKYLILQLYGCPTIKPLIYLPHASALESKTWDSNWIHHH
jgi:hypothetical protein